MHNNTVKQMVLAGLMLAMGIVLPVTFHMLGLGSTFLPMHIPVLLAGFILDLPFAFLVGAATPLLSSLLTGMPPLFPVLPYMVCELAAYAAVASIMSSRKYNVYLSLLASMLAGRIVAGLAVWVLANLFAANLPSPPVFVASAVTTGLPGIVVQLVLLPPLVVLLNKARFSKKGALQIER